MNRRGFLASCLALCAAPAIVRADSLMRVIPRETGVISDVAYEWTQYAGPPVIVTFSDIVSETLRLRSHEIAESIITRNALLRKFQEEQLRGSLWSAGSVP